MMDGEQLAEEARSSISSFCYEECHSYCCRKGFLILKPDEVQAVTQGRQEELRQTETLKPTRDGRLSLNLNHGGCPSLKDFKCSIHTSSQRPKTCGDFPVYLHGKRVFFSPRCLAVKEGRFYGYEKEFMRNGYEIVKAHPWADSEIYNVTLKLDKPKDIAPPART